MAEPWLAIPPIVAAALSAIFVSFLTEMRRLRFVPEGPTCAREGEHWIFYHEFRPETGWLRKSDSAAVNAGGAVHVRNAQGKSEHHAESVWAGDPVVGTANLYAKKGLLVCLIFPRSHMVMFCSAGTAPHADKLEPGKGSLGWLNLDYSHCKDWSIQILASAPDAAAGKVTTTVSELCSKAVGVEQFPKLAPIVTDRDTLAEGMVIKGSDNGIFLIQDGQRRWIPNPHIFVAIGLNWDDVIRVTDNLLNQIPRGSDVSSHVRHHLS